MACKGVMESRHDEHRANDWAYRNLYPDGVRERMGIQLDACSILGQCGHAHGERVMHAAVSVPLTAPFPWFGGKRKVARQVWDRFGNIKNYVEPFFGSGAVLLGRPNVQGIETVNDKDGFVSNFWRSLQRYPEQVARYADNPINENDLHARHIWLVQQREDLTQKLEGHPDFCDAQIAGYWVWGVSCWIGGGFCSGSGPWILSEDQRLLRVGIAGNDCGTTGTGVHRRLIHLGNAGRGVCRQRNGLLDYMHALAERMRHVRVSSGHWDRICGPSITYGFGLTGVFLDPPYSDLANRTENLYAVDCIRVAHEVRDWAIAHGDHPLMRIAMCGYEGEHVMPDNWSVYEWNAGVGYGAQAEKQTENGKRERIWFSPLCQGPKQRTLF